MSLPLNFATRQPSRHLFQQRAGHPLKFATLQFASLIYLQKFAFFAHSSGSVNGRLIAADDFSVPVELVIMSAGVSWMVLLRYFTIVPSRLAVFLVFLVSAYFRNHLP